MLERRSLVKIQRAPRTKKRIACDLTIDGDRYKGIVLDVSAFGIFVQTNARPNPGAFVELSLTLQGGKSPVAMEATVARRNVVPPQLLAVAKGGIGLAIEDPPKEFLDFLSEVSRVQSEFVATERSKGAVKAGRGRPRSAEGGGRNAAAGSGSGAPAPKRFRIHAVDSKSGERNTFLVVSASEEDAKTKVGEELGDDWQVLFVERT